MTTLPANAERLGRRIDASLATLAQAPDPARASLLFVLDDPARPSMWWAFAGWKARWA